MNLLRFSKKKKIQKFTKNLLRYFPSNDLQIVLKFISHTKSKVDKYTSRHKKKDIGTHKFYFSTQISL